MRIWFRRRRIAAFFWAVLALAATEGSLLLYYLNSWLTLPLL